MKKEVKIAKKLYENYKCINRIIPNLNYGGCGVFAENLYVRLVKLGLKPKIAIITDDIKGVKRFVRLSKYNPCSRAIYLTDIDVHHIVIKLGNKLMDSEGVYDNISSIKHYRRQVFKLYDKVPIRLLKEMNDTLEWNPCFNRKSIFRVEHILEESYNKVKKSLVV
jgi:hypothetical protein